MGEEREDGGSRAESERRGVVELPLDEGESVRWASRREMSAGMRERGFEDDMPRWVLGEMMSVWERPTNEQEVSFDTFAQTRHPAQWTPFSPLSTHCHLRGTQHGHS